MDIYAQNILDHYKHPRNKHVMPDAHIQAHELNSSCGDEIEVYLKFDGEKISQVSFDGHGCAISTATISMLSEYLIGRNKSEILKLTIDDIRHILGIEISERRSKCALIGLSAIQNAIKKSLTHL